MTTFLIVLHVIACVFLIAVVLLQRGKGAEIGAVFGGGGSTTVFGSRGAGNFLTKLTALSATIFLCTSMALSVTFARDSADRLFADDAALEAAEPGEQAPLFEEVGVAPALEQEPEAPVADAPASEPGLLPELPAPRGDGGTQ